MKAGDFEAAREYNQKKTKAEEKRKRQKERLENRQNARSEEVSQADIEEVVSLWTKIPVKRLAGSESSGCSSWISFSTSG